MKSALFASTICFIITALCMYITFAAQTFNGASFMAGLFGGLGEAWFAVAIFKLSKKIVDTKDETS